MEDSKGGSSSSSDFSQMALLNMLSASASGALPFPFSTPSFLPPELMANLMRMPNQAQLAAMQSSPTKRARTRITDDQLKVLRQYFDINNSPSEEQIREMSIKAKLPEKVIKHWFRNTLFKERQRDKDSPYNFSIPPSVGIDLDAYEKTGETKVVSLNNDSLNTTVKEVKKEKEESPAKEILPSSSQSVSSPSLNLTSMLNSALNGDGLNSFPFSIPDGTNIASLLSGGLSLPSSVVSGSGSNQCSSSSSIMGTSSSSSSTGRRANRTRFTDHQLRTLQQFFDKQAYPKDDDLEMLSKKLQLSPRVIVVWFQNARQKARKIYENQPTVEGVERFVRTPGCNFQCKRCALVFQRYYELIEHQQKTCYKDDANAAATDNKTVEANLSSEERSQVCQSSSSSPPPQSSSSIDQQSTVIPSATINISGAGPVDLAKILGKSSTEALLKLCEDQTRSHSTNSSNNSQSPTSSNGSSSFNKRCPLCNLHFRSSSSMIDHLHSRHSDHPPIDIDLLPDADDIRLSIDPLKREIPLDLSQYERGETLSISPFLSTASDGDDGIDIGLDDSSSPNIQPRSPNANSKRYRTHLTPLQVYIMKCIFNDYKTPSMPECQLLGKEIGLDRRVVQVWFQNARAKERKSRPNGESEPSTQQSIPSSCSLCGVEYGNTKIMQEHLFSPSHINRLRNTTKDELIEKSENGDECLRVRGNSMRDSGRVKGSTPLTSSSRAFPLNLLMGLQGMSSSGLPLLMDPSVIGTPIALLQIPESIKNKISNDIATAGTSSTTFTQDGHSIESLKNSISNEDAMCVEGNDIQVGWACPGCSNVFQRESMLISHQKTVCTTSHGSFALIQTHYRCIMCECDCGSQKDFKTHISTAEHITRLKP